MITKYKTENKTYLVTGGTGFLGKPLVKRLLNDGVKVRTLSRSETKIVELKQELPTVDVLTGDVYDKVSIRQAMAGVNGVFHLAASKHIGISEKYVRECTNSNIIGSLNILEQSLEQDLDFILGISTDKAAQVSGVYGASKFLMERLFRQFEEMNHWCDYRLVRYGNVLYSTGSVLCKWKDLIIDGKDVVVTEPKATRFFWSVDQALDLVYDCLNNSTDCTPYVPTMKGMSVENLLEAMIQKYGDGRRPNVKIIGLQPGENFHEKIVEYGPYSNEVDQYTIEEIKSLI